MCLCLLFSSGVVTCFACPVTQHFQYLLKILLFFLRFIHGRTNITEIYPGDDSVFKSEGAFLGKYFIHYAIQKGTKKVQNYLKTKTIKRMFQIPSTCSFPKTFVSLCVITNDMDLLRCIEF